LMNFSKPISRLFIHYANFFQDGSKHWAAFVLAGCFLSTLVLNFNNIFSISSGCVLTEFLKKTEKSHQIC
jgi:hypothetical protein